MKKRNREIYEAPFTKKTQVEVEASMCAGSDVSIDKNPTQGNVEVDEYATIDNDVTFE